MDYLKRYKKMISLRGLIDTNYPLIRPKVYVSVYER